MVSIPISHLGRKPKSCNIGPEIVCITTPQNDPITDQNGISKPVKIGPKLRATPIGVAGRIFTIISDEFKNVFIEFL